MRTISKEIRKKVFFYADEDAKYYDILEELTQPYIDLIHDTMVDLIEYSLTWNNDNRPDRPYYLLDIASGTGAEAFRLLKRFENINIVTVDFSPPMNREFRRKFDELYPECNINSKVTMVEEDFFSKILSQEKLISLLPENLIPRAFDGIIAGFFLHHYPTEIKKEFFKKTHALLRPSGALVLCEAINFMSKGLSEFSHDFGERWIRKQFSTPDEHLLSKVNKLGKDAMRLKQSWIEHWNNTHIYSPDTEFDKIQTSDHKKLNPSYASMAMNAGYKDIGFPFRFWEVGVLWAKK
jgi:SAM-dependent methyltransferase